MLPYLYATDSSSWSHTEEVKASLSFDTKLTTKEFGLLVGFGFSLFYCVFSLVAGHLADNTSRVLILCQGLVLWNGATFLTGAATDFQTLLLARLMLGLGQAFSAPACYSIIAAYVPPCHLAQANALCKHPLDECTGKSNSRALSATLRAPPSSTHLDALGTYFGAGLEHKGRGIAPKVLRGGSCTHRNASHGYLRKLAGGEG